jgi:hypothetical protein
MNLKEYPIKTASPQGTGGGKYERHKTVFIPESFNSTAPCFYNGRNTCEYFIQLLLQ